MLTCLRQCPAAAVNPSSSGGGPGENSVASPPSGPSPAWYGTPRYVAISPSRMAQGSAGCQATPSYRARSASPSGPSRHMPAPTGIGIGSR